MSNTNLPSGTGGDDALSFDDGVDAIDAILDPATDLPEEDQAKDDQADTEEAEESAEADEAETDETETPDAEDEDGQQEYSGGKFASDNAKVTLKDGTVLSVQDLKRGFMSQQYFTRETQALSEDKKSVEAAKSQVSEYAQTLAQQRDFLLQAAQQFLPQMPDRSMIQTDIVGYQEAVAEYQERMGVVQQLQQYATAEQARVQQEQEQAQAEVRKAEGQRLLEAMPELKKPEVYQKFWADTVDTMAEYGFSTDDLNAAMDHRYYLVFRDLMKYRKARQQAPKVTETVKGKPVLQAGKRMDPKAKISRERQARHEHLRNTGSFDAGVAALMDLDL